MIAHNIHSTSGTEALRIGEDARRANPRLINLFSFNFIDHTHSKPKSRKLNEEKG
jgi:hypothetical protein